MFLQKKRKRNAWNFPKKGLPWSKSCSTMTCLETGTVVQTFCFLQKFCRILQHFDLRFQSPNGLSCLIEKFCRIWNHEKNVCRRSLRTKIGMLLLVNLSLIIGNDPSFKSSLYLADLNQKTRNQVGISLDNLIKTILVESDQTRFVSDYDALPLPL